MKDNISAALLAFYGNILQPEFLALKEKLSEHDEKLADILSHFDTLYNRFETLEEEYQTIVHGMERIEKKVGLGVYEPVKLQKEIASMKAKLSGLQKRLEQLERRTTS
jgi:predicted nuclease with TOPRIM domain